MGNFGSRGCAYNTRDPERAVSKRIDKLMRAEAVQRRRQKVVKVLLFGEAGVSALLKQLRILYGKPWEGLTEEELLERRNDVFQTVVSGMLELLQAAKKYEGAQLAGPEDTLTAAKRRSLRGEEINMTEQLKACLLEVWENPAVQTTWRDYRRGIPTSECIEYFMAHSYRLLQQNYEVTEADWHHARHASSALVNRDLRVGAVVVKVYDVRGQRNETRKWMHLFHQVDALFAVVPIHLYDETSYDDGSVNKLQAVMHTFYYDFNNHYIDASAIVVFMNNSTTFRAKLQVAPIKCEDRANPYNNRWEDYEGPDEMDDLEAQYDAGIEYFRHKIQALNSKPSTEVFTHVVDLNNADTVDAALQAVAPTLQWSLVDHFGYV